MKKCQFVVGVVMMALVVTMTSCAGSCNEKTLFSTENVSESRQLKGFEEIEINGSPTIYYTQTDSFSVKVKGPEEYVKNILTEKKITAIYIAIPATIQKLLIIDPSSNIDEVMMLR